jgi:transmembrane sensor
MPPISTEQIERLAEKMMLGTITPEEQAMLDEWARQVPGDQLYWASGDANEAGLKSRLLARIRETAGLEEGHEEMETTVRRMPLVKRVRWSAAAVVLLLLAGGSYLFLHRPSGVPSMASTAAASKSVGAPGHDAAILTLSGGRQILLDSTMQDTILTEGNDIIAGTKGRLAYNPGSLREDQGSSAAGGETIYNTLSTARGGQYQLTLPDGTKAWLNASSSIRYPTAFTGTSRPVTITGEVYFEVAINPHRPFVVTAGATDITVLGTHFDVMAYSDESHLRTTLVEGAVRVQQGDQTTLLHPGEQARINAETHRITVKKVETGDAIAWVNGRLSLESDDIGTLMRQISRWYNVDVRYEGTPPNARLFGTINRNVNLSDILTALGNYGIKARLSGTTIVISAQ